MSENSLRNLIFRREHKERSQPKAREHLGILEKKKDYKVRAAHDKRSREYIKSLQRAAALKNPDEYAFAMAHGNDERGITAGSGDSAIELTPEQVRAMKHEDLLFYQRRLLSIQRQRERAQTETLIMDGQSAPIVASTVEEAERELASRTRRSREDELRSARTSVSAADLFGAALSGSVGDLDQILVQTMRQERSEALEQAVNEQNQLLRKNDTERETVSGVITQLSDRLKPSTTAKGRRR